MGIGGRNKRAVLSCFIAILVLASGGALGELGEPVCSDDFNSPSGGWDVGTYDVGTVAYRNGSFRIRMARHGELLWSWSPCKSVPDDFVMKVQGHTRPGINTASWGVVWGVDDDNLLVFLITPSGMSTVLSMRNGKPQPSVIPWHETVAIDRGDGVPNTLWVTVDGDSVTVGINHYDVGHFEIGESPDLAAGLLEGAKSSGPGPVSLADGSGWKVGVVGGSFDMTPVELDFDTFELFELP
jgi:hypothetical protein